MDLNLFDSLIRILMIAVVVVILCKRLNFPAIIGYIAIGVVVGPHLLGWVPDTEDTYALADFGVVFLMFTIGLEFSLSRMWRMKNLVFGLGGAQVLLTLLVTTIIGLACITSLSSTAIVSKQLVDQNELNSPHGNNAISILLFQDLAVIPFFILISSFIQQTDVMHWPMLLSFGKAFLLIMAMLALGRWILRPLFREIAATESLELFTLSVLLVTLVSAWLTHRFGLSLALGSFMAGMMLGETEFRHQIEATIRPFRDLLLGLFFITVGMLFNVRSIVVIWPWVLLLLAALTLLKVFIVSMICRYVENDVPVAVRTGLVMAQGSEFGFALLSLALMGNLLPMLYGQVVLGALLFSMALAPLIIRWNEKIMLLAVPEKYLKKVTMPKKTADIFAKGLEHHVILCGFSRVGQNKEGNNCQILE